MLALPVTWKAIGLLSPGSIILHLDDLRLATRSPIEKKQTISEDDMCKDCRKDEPCEDCKKKKKLPNDRRLPVPTVKEP